MIDMMKDRQSIKKEILVVDDDQDVCHSIKNIFEHEGYHVITVNNGYECIDKLTKGFQGIILMDIMMPYMDGWDTIKNIIAQGLNCNNEIVVITAVGTLNHEKIKGLEGYIYDYIPKPFNISDLISSVKKAQ